MKILLYSDNHFSQYSSILRSNDVNSIYSKRLINQIDSINWVERTAEQEGADYIICLGDFFDKPELNALEITALKEIQWSKRPHYFLVGNHEMGKNDLSINSTYALKDVPYCLIVDKISSMYTDTAEIIFLPYILNSSEISLHKILPDKTMLNRIVLSHNDIAGINFGKYISKDGLSLKDINENCDLFINGHIHNGEELAPNIYNIGNLTGQNFSEDGFKYGHNVMLIDLKDLSIKFISNPYAIYFYKIDLTVTYLNDYLKNYLINNYSVATFTCNLDYLDTLREQLKNFDKLLDYRIIVKNNYKANNDENSQIELTHNLDHIQKFKDYFIQKYGDDDLILSELGNII